MSVFYSVLSSLLQGTGTACPAVPSGGSFQRVFGPRFLTHDPAVKDILFLNVECFGRFATLKLPWCNGSRTLSHAGALHPCMPGTVGTFVTGGYFSSLHAACFRRFLLALTPGEMSRSCFSVFV